MNAVLPTYEIERNPGRVNATVRTLRCQTFKHGRHSQGGGVARQTLYNSFNNKDAVLRIHIQVYTEIVIVEIRVGLESMNALGPQLDLVKKMAVVGYGLIQALPNAEDVVEGIDASSRDAPANAARSFSSVIANTLSSQEIALAQSGLSSTGLADYVQCSAVSIKCFAIYRELLLRQLITLRNLCLAAVRVTNLQAYPAPPYTVGD